MSVAAAAIEPEKDIDLDDRESISSSESIYNGSAEERFVILRRLRSDINTAFARFRPQFDNVKGFSDKEIQEDDDKFNLAADAHAERRSLIRAIILWVNECHELLDPKTDVSTIEASALVLRRLGKNLRKFPQRIPDDPLIHQKLVMPTVDDVMAPLRSLRASAASVPSNLRDETQKDNRERETEKGQPRKSAFQFRNFPPLPPCTVGHLDSLLPPIGTRLSAAGLTTGANRTEDNGGVEDYPRVNGKNSQVGCQQSYATNIPLHNRFQLLQGGEVDKGEERGSTLPSAQLPSDVHVHAQPNLQLLVDAESSSRLKQIASQQARDARPSSKFSRGQPMDFKNFMMRFQIAVSSPGMDARSKMIEMTHWFASPAVEVIDAFIVWEDPDSAYSFLCSELNIMFGAEGDSAIPLIRQLATGSSLDEYDHDAHILLYTKLIQAESTARAFNRMDQLDRRDTLVEIVENRLKHLVKDFWRKDVALQKDEGRFVRYADFKQMLSQWIKILSSRRPHIKPDFKQFSHPIKQQQPLVTPRARRTAADASSPKQLSTIQCNICRSPHATEDCASLLSMSMEDKSEKLKQLRLCFHCLQPGHVHRFCPTPPGCTLCTAFHHTIFHGRQTRNGDADVDDMSQRSGNEEEEEGEEQHDRLSNSEGGSG